MTTATITLRDGSKVTIKGQQLTVEGLEDIPFIVHHDLQFTKGWMVTEPVTGARILSDAMSTRALACNEAKERCSVAGAKEYVRREVSKARVQLMEAR